MIPNYQDRQIESSGISDMAAFGISQDDAAHIMTILRDTLYSDKFMAVLREYAANAWDAHNMVGKKDVPIKVILPTHKEPTLIIKDYGPGLSHEDVFQVYTQYGASTKRTSNVAVGQLGIGSKSGFAYSDSFTVISCNGGKQRTYVAVLDDTEKGVINLLDEQDCGFETGITIQIPVKAEDISEFVTKATNLFKFFNPRPDINIYLPPEIPVQAKLKSGVIYDADRHNGGEWIATMGCIPYRLNLSQINALSDTNDKTGVRYWVNQLSGVLYFDIGEVHISASREELKYSKSTKEAIIKRFIELADEFVSTTLEAIQNTAVTSWDKRLRAQILTKFNLPVPDKGKDLSKSYIEIQDTPENCAKTFTFRSKTDNVALHHFPIHHTTKILLVDDLRKTTGFRLINNDLLLYKNDLTQDWKVVLEELDTYLKQHMLDGVTIAKLSNQTWYAPFSKLKVKKIVNPKYLRRSFVFAPHNSYYDPYSRYWDATDDTRVATDDDVFVLIKGFKTESPCGFNLFTDYKVTKELAEFFGVKMPPIYGYKTSEKVPLSVTDCAGIYYPEWKKKFITTLSTGVAKSYLEVYDWQKCYEYHGVYNHDHPLDMRTLGEKLGRNHSIYNYLKTVKKNYKLWGKVSPDRRHNISTLARLYFSQEPTAEKSGSKLVLNTIYQKYPLLSCYGKIEALWGGHNTQWIEYVQLVDRMTGVLTLTPLANKEEEENDE